MAQTVKKLPANVGDPGSITGLGRSPGGGNGNLLQHSCLENSMDRATVCSWQATVHGIAESDITEQLTQRFFLSFFFFLFVVNSVIH